MAAQSRLKKTYDTIAVPTAGKTFSITRHSKTYTSVARGTVNNLVKYVPSLALFHQYKRRYGGRVNSKEL